MKKIHLLSIALGSLLACSCGPKAPVDNYSLTVVTPDDVEQGVMAYLINYDDDAVLDSALVDGDTLKFSGYINEPIMARVKFPTARRTFILEPGDIYISNDGTTKGTELNSELEQLGARINELEAEDNDSTLQLLKTLCHESIVKENPLGYYALLQISYYVGLTELDSMLKSHPYYSDFTRVQRIRNAKVQAAKTAPGQHYADFEIADTANTSVKLSDYVKPGQYTIVDFWASWCRYCIMEIPNLKELSEKYGNRGLNIVGVAVWDEREASERSIEKHEVTWPQILDAQSVPTDLYGVTGIPQIMLIDPDGVIVARDLQGERLKTVVDSVMTGFVIPQQ